MRAIIFPVLAIAGLSACDTATDPSITAADVIAANAEYTRLADLPLMALDDLPTADATYSGQLGGDVTVSAVEGYAILADVSLTADFGSDGALSGEINNINLIEDGTPTQLLDGSLDVSGNATSIGFAATATGTLIAFGEDLPFVGTSVVGMTLSGTQRDDTAAGGSTALVGAWDNLTSVGSFEIENDDSGWVYATQD